MYIPKKKAVFRFDGPCYIKNTRRAAGCARKKPSKEPDALPFTFMTEGLPRVLQPGSEPPPQTNNTSFL
jgi:hypothetical protein